MVELSERTVLALYAGVGVLLVSSLHVWYVHVTGRNPRFGFPMTEFGVGLSPAYGYVGSILVGAVTVWAVWLLVRAINPSEVTELGELNAVIVPGILLVVLLVALAQFATGASYSKLVLHGLVLGMTGLAMVTVVRPFTIPELLTTYVSLLAFLLLLGNLWIQYLDEFTLPHFPSAAYFGLSALYVLVGSLLLIGWLMR